MTRPCQWLAALAYLTLIVGLTLGQNRNTEFTFLLPAGSAECFYQTTMKNDNMEVEYQVIAGSGLDVEFTLDSPSGVRLASDFRRFGGIHAVDPTEDGEYRLCFDNKFSKVAHKKVFFGVMVDNRRTGYVEWVDVARTDDVSEYEPEDVKEVLDSVHKRLQRVRQTQITLRSFEARDRFLLEDNLWRVSFWSCVSLLVMVAVSAAQLYTLQFFFHVKKGVRT